MLIVIGIDGSRGSDEAVRWVAQHGPALDASVTTVHVLSRVDLWDLAAMQIDTAPIGEAPRTAPCRMDRTASRRGLTSDNSPPPLRDPAMES